MLTKSRLDSCIDTVRGQCAAKPVEALKADATMAITFQEHFSFQQQQAEAHASGLLETAAAQTIYAALGEVHSDSNGGWSKGTDTATKVVVTQLMAELLGRKLGRSGR